MPGAEAATKNKSGFNMSNQLKTNLRNRGYGTYQKISSKRTAKDEKKAA